jgi:hypothetical protein
MEVDCRLQGVEPTLQIIPLQTRSSTTNFSKFNASILGSKSDQKDAYFHVPIHQDLKLFLRHQIGDQIWEYQGGCLGLNVMPKIFMSIMKTFEKNGDKKEYKYTFTWTIFWLLPPFRSLWIFISKG